MGEMKAILCTDCVGLDGVCACTVSVDLLSCAARVKACLVVRARAGQAEFRARVRHLNY